MNERDLLAELRNALQAVAYEEEILDGKVVRLQKLIVTDETQRAQLTAKYVALLNSISPNT